METQAFTTSSHSTKNILPLTGSNEVASSAEPADLRVQELSLPVLNRVTHTDSVSPASTASLTKLKGKVTILVGGSSVGKSTLIRAMRELNPKLYESGIDLARDRKVISFLKTHSSDHYDFLRDRIQLKDENLDVINFAFGGPKERSSLFKKEVSPEDRETANQWGDEFANFIMKTLEESPLDVNTLAIEEINAATDRGEDAVFDLTEFDAIDTNELFQKTLATRDYQVAFVYCPFNVLVDHIDKRNQMAISEGKPTESRVGYFPLHKFSELFGPVNSSRGYEELHRQDIVRGFDRLFEYIVSTSLDRLHRENPQVKGEDLTALETAKRVSLEFDHLKNLSTFLEAMGFKDEDSSIHIAPRRASNTFIPIDMAATTAPQEGAARLSTSNTVYK